MTAPHPRDVLRARGLAPKKSFGQNFLVAADIVNKIAAACVPDSERGHAHVVEIGAGLGALTGALLARAARVTAIERDRDLAPILREAFADAIARGALVVLEADAQSVDFAAHLGAGGAGGAAPEVGPRVLAGNLPYQITGSLLERAVHDAASLDRAVFMVQEEVATRLLASPATKEYGALTVFVRAAFDVSRVARVSPSSFFPSPEVTSCVVALRPLRPPRARETEGFRAVVKAAFGMRRKKLRNAWHAVAPNGDTLAKAAASAGVSLDARGETLDVDAFARMADALASLGVAHSPAG